VLNPIFFAGAEFVIVERNIINEKACMCLILVGEGMETMSRRLDASMSELHLHPAITNRMRPQYVFAAAPKWNEAKVKFAQAYTCNRDQKVAFSSTSFLFFHFFSLSEIAGHGCCSF
jgi:hypothetical protein